MPQKQVFTFKRESPLAAVGMMTFLCWEQRRKQWVDVTQRPQWEETEWDGWVNKPSEVNRRQCSFPVSCQETETIVLSEQWLQMSPNIKSNASTSRSFYQVMKQSLLNTDSVMSVRVSHTFQTILGLTAWGKTLLCDLLVHYKKRFALFHIQTNYCSPFFVFFCFLFFFRFP